ncbi:MAG: DUF2294 domain-containing protein [Firmicutes bacterium]|nr:DUF2294 domain-containing protein [Bacillota bacterium]
MPKKSRLEAEITNLVVKLQREILGRGPEDARSYIVHDMVILRLKGVLTTVEKHLTKSEKGCQVVKQMREVLRETYAEEEEQIIANVTGCKVISSHSDISTKTGERIEIFILDRNLEELLQNQS